MLLAILLYPGAPQWINMAIVKWSRTPREPAYGSFPACACRAGGSTMRLLRHCGLLEIPASHCDTISVLSPVAPWQLEQQQPIRMSTQCGTHYRHYRHAHAHTLHIHTHKPKTALKAILKASKHNPLTNEDPTPTDLSVISDHLQGGITSDPPAVRAVIEDMQRKALSPDPDVDPHAPFPWEQDVPPALQPDTTLIIGHLTQDVFDEALHRNPNYKAPGPDEIPGVILNNMPASFLKTTLALFQLMATTGITPPAWLKTHTVLLYKKGDPLCIDNYRPIALAPILYKLWASCLTILASRYVEANKILSPEQEGFRFGRSTARAIIHLLLAIEDAHSHGKDILICYLDFKGAYPSADHTQLTRLL